MIEVVDMLPRRVVFVDLASHWVSSVLSFPTGPQDIECLRALLFNVAGPLDDECVQGRDF